MSNASILLIDDDPVVLASVGPNLQRAGFRVFTAASWEEAVQRVKTEPPDLAIIDLALPRADPSEVLADGMALLGWLRSGVSAKKIAAIIYTASLSPATAARAKASGAFAALQKDCELRELLEAIHGALAANVRA